MTTKRIEKPNEYVLEYILNNSNSLFSDLSEDDKFDRINQLKRYKNKMKKGIVDVSYCQRGAIFLGRTYTKCALQNMKKDVRNSLTISKYYDIDIENAMFSIMRNYAKNNNLDTPNLKKYVAQRQQLLSNCIFNKEDIISYINGGPQPMNTPEWLLKMKKEFETIEDWIYLKNPEFVKWIKKKMKREGKTTNERGIVLSHFYQMEEKKVIDLAIQFLESKKYIVGSIIHDGFLIEKDERIKIDIEELNEFMSVRNHKVKFIIKPMEKLLNIPKNILYKKRQEYDEEMRQKYEELKEKFEMKTAKILNPFVYITTDINGEKCFEKGSNIKSKYIDWKEAIQNDKVLKFPFYTDTEKPKTFIENYINDPTKTIYDKIDFIPSKNECPDNVYNLFDGFEVFKIDKVNTYSENTKPRFDKLLNHFKFLVNDGSEDVDKYFDYVMQIFAHMILNPMEKTKVLPVFKSKEGWGKNIMTDYIGKEIMGDKYHLETRNASKEIFGDFNGIMAEKLFVVFDEADPDETKIFYEKLKGEITNNKFILKRKGIENTTIKSFVNYVSTTNNEGTIKISKTNRRFSMFECTQPKPTHEYFEELNFSENSIMKDKEVKLMFIEYLESIFNKNYDFSNIPKSNYYKRSAELCKVPMDDFLNYFYQMNFDNPEKTKEPKKYTKGKKKDYYWKFTKDMYNEYKSFLNETNGEIVSQQKFKALLLEKEIFKLDRNTYGSELIYKKDVLVDYLKNNDIFQLLDKVDNESNGEED